MSVVVEVSARKFVVPRACVCCDGPSEVELAASYTRRTGKRVIRETTRSLDFPYCASCYAHVMRWKSANLVAGFVMVIGLVVAILVGNNTNSDTGIAVFVAFDALGLGLFVWVRVQARRLCTGACTAPGPAVENLGWSGSVSSFEFASQRYAAKFAMGNAPKLINVSRELSTLLEMQASEPRDEIDVAVHRSRPVPQQTPPSARHESSQPDLVLAWVERIEGYKGPEARRNALRRALEEITEPTARQELKLAASRIEVAAVLDKVDGLASPAAKKRHLEHAIADLHADDVPDELQADLFRQLAERLRNLT